MKILYFAFCGVFASPAVVINTWPFTQANDAAWEVLANGGSVLDAITVGICVQISLIFRETI